MSEPALMTVPEVAAMLRVSNWTVRHEIHERRLRATKVGRHWRVFREWVIAYAEGNATGPEVADAETLRGWVGVPAEPGREVGRHLGGSGGEAPASVRGGRVKRGSDPADAGGPTRGRGIELQVAKADRKRRRISRKVA